MCALSLLACLNSSLLSKGKITQNTQVFLVKCAKLGFYFTEIMALYCDALSFPYFRFHQHQINTSPFGSLP